MHDMVKTNEPQWVETSVDDGIATIRIHRHKVNALVPEVLEELRSTLGAMESDSRAVILTGTGPFFSFGWDVPHMLKWPRPRFGAFVSSFCELYRELFLYSKPVIAALNGHAVAGGCMLALAADCRVMASEKAKLSLNEITFGASVFAGFVEMLRFHVDGRTAARVLNTGEMLDADEATALGLVDRVESTEHVIAAALEMAIQLSKNPETFSSIKRLLRGGVGERMAALEPKSIEEFLDIWYSRSTQEQIARITIR